MKEPSAANRQELADLLVELAQWSGVAEKNGDLHARIASALALESSAADESVGERQGRQPAQDIWSDPAAARERLYASAKLESGVRESGQNDAQSVEPSNAANTCKCGHTRGAHGTKCYSPGCTCLAWVDGLGEPTRMVTRDKDCTIHGDLARARTDSDA